jgi:hypothetical protein
MWKMAKGKKGKAKRAAMAATPMNIPDVAFNPRYSMIITGTVNVPVATSTRLTLDGPDLARLAFTQLSTLAKVVMTAPGTSTTFPWNNVRVRKVNAWGVQGGSVSLEYVSSAAVPPPPEIDDTNAGYTDRPFTSRVAPQFAWSPTRVISGGSNPQNVVDIAFIGAVTGTIVTSPTAYVHVHVDLW